MLVLSGAGLKQNAHLTHAKNIDIGATIAHLLGIDLGSVTGRVLRDAGFGKEARSMQQKQASSLRRQGPQGLVPGSGFRQREERLQPPDPQAHPVISSQNF
jgi:hypothetical protein